MHTTVSASHCNLPTDVVGCACSLTLSVRGRVCAGTFVRVHNRKCIIIILVLANFDRPYRLFAPLTLWLRFKFGGHPPADITFETYDSSSISTYGSFITDFANNALVVTPNMIGLFEVWLVLDRNLRYQNNTNEAEHAGLPKVRLCVHYYDLTIGLRRP